MHLLARLSSVWLCLLTISYSQTIHKQTHLRIYALRAPAYSDDIMAAQRIAMNVINNDTNILGDYFLTYQILDVSKSTSDAIDKVLKISASNSLLNNNDNSISIPIILGPPFSSYSIVTSPAANAFHWSLLSSAATAVSLSNTQHFPQFYRSIPSDALNARGVIQLCLHFNWTHIAVIYTSDVWGTYFANGIVELAIQYNVKTDIISYGRDLNGYKYAAETLAKIHTYIGVIVAHPDEIVALFETLIEKNMHQFPYFYIGTGSWFDTASIKQAKLQKYCKGFIGAGLYSLPDGAHKDVSIMYENINLSYVYQKSSVLYSKFEKLFRDNHGNGNNEITPFHLYGWDSMYVLSYVMDIFDKKYNLSNILSMNMSFIGDNIHNIILNDISFLGLTGNISFDTNGDRSNGLYSFSNIIDDNGTIKYIGIYSDKFSKITSNNITWPKQFVEYGIIPKSHKITTNKLVDVNNIIRIIAMLLSILSITTVFIYIILLFKNRDNLIIKAVSWKLNLISCFGCIIAYIDVILYWNTRNNISCNVREWLLAISFTMVFMPLFLKTYRISVIFTGLLGMKTIPDWKLVFGVLLCLIIDITLLSIFTVLDPDIIKYVNGHIESIHGLEDQQIIYETCGKQHDTIQLIYYISISLWKGIQLIFGVYVAMIVSRIGLEQVNRFRETKSQLIAILFTVVTLLMASIPITFTHNYANNIFGYGETRFYMIISIVSLISGNFILHSNMLERFIVIYSQSRRASQFEKMEEELITELMTSRFRRASQFPRFKSAFNHIMQTENEMELTACLLSN